MIQDNVLAKLNVSSVEYNKVMQKRKILMLLHSNGFISAPELSKKLKISMPTCLVILNDLIASGYVKNYGVGESSGGRKPALYGLPEDSYYVISCDFARYSASMAIINVFNRLVTPVVSIDTCIDDNRLVAKLYHAALKLCSDYSIPFEKVLALGVDMPGLVDSKSGTNYTIKSEKYQLVGNDLKKQFRKMVFVDNDARMHAYGEYYFGVAKGYKDAVIIHWSWGIGLGMFVNGRLYSGNNGFAGEFSHIPIVENGDLCICGKRGCLETIASSNTVLKRVRMGIAENQISKLIDKFKNNPDQITPEHVISAARKGDEFCVSILSDVGKAMGRGLSYIIQLLNPEVIVLSGPLSKANQYVLSPIQQSLNRLCLEKISGNTSIIISDHGDLSALLGTSEMALQKIFSEISFEEPVLQTK